MNKVGSNLLEAVSVISDGASVMIGGFGGSGAPIELIHALIDSGAKDLTVINNNAGNGHVGIAALIEQRRVARIICSFPRSADPRVFNELYLAGDIELEIVPQGTLAERIRAGGAGIPAFYTPTGVGTETAVGKEEAIFDGKRYLQERWLKADYALIKADLADTVGNLTYRRAARNFNPLMAMAAKTTIAQASNVVQAGEIDPDQVITPGIFVDTIVEVKSPKQEEVLNREGACYPC
ncbi:3-oxoacid CoA-transferase subunit A [Marinobacterium mangrovicola]|uniref:3-oxoadipate CoA-transferase alpha subunit n=1 Tax=Marinobacterium mangrovicola TaxID=1476959 RepID=A0A4R1G5L4_9GAMM|nr:3-oxoacid CoA-transferase subunit A [Marinobacterium mangrovicola]TCK02934.1 3-oxoadipate CoA-transferase alpha subunit [Marinobacterium mangrovicola]